MNKTVTINISGIIFHIEEDAFEKLSKYLSTIKGYFSSADGGNEIMSDIEARIAEMLQSKTSAIKQVVLMSDVDYVMDSMGKPEEFAPDSQENSNQTQSTETEHTYYEEPAIKRIYRDGDSKVLGGVCSGIGHYFGFDPVWLRIALVLLLFFAGTGVLIYIIMWIAIPEARTTAEKLAMKGERADINNISKAVKEEAEQLKKRMEKYGSEFKNKASGSRDLPRNALEKFIYFLLDVLKNIGKVIMKIIGIVMIIIGFIFFIGLFGSVFGFSLIGEGKEWIDMLLLDGKDLYLGLVGIIIFVGIPTIMMIYVGIKLLFKISYSNRWLNLSAGIVWLFGFIVLLYVGTKMGRDFNKVAKIRENVAVKAHDTLYLKLNEVSINYEELQNSDEAFEGEKDFLFKGRNNNYMIGKHDNTKYVLGYARLNIIKSQTNKVELVVVKEARGRNKTIANDRAKHISYNVIQTDSLLTFDDIFKINDIDKFRLQDINVILKIPVNQVIYLDKSIENLIYDIENLTNTYDGDMVNRRWLMTESGLKCIDCDGLDIDEETESNVHVSEDGVNVKSEDGHVKVDQNGVNIKSNNTKVVIDKNGVHVNTKEEK